MTALFHWDCPISLGLPYFIRTTLPHWDCPTSLGLPYHIGTALLHWDCCPTSLGLPYFTRTTLPHWDCPTSLGLLPYFTDCPTLLWLPYFTVIGLPHCDCPTSLWLPGMAMTALLYLGFHPFALLLYADFIRTSYEPFHLLQRQSLSFGWCQSHKQACMGNSGDHGPHQNFTADLSDFPLQNGSHQGFQVRSGSQIIDCNYCFCHDHFFVCFLHWCVVFHQNSHGTAPVLLEAVLMENNTENKTSREVIVIKMVITSDYLAARLKCRVADCPTRLWLPYLVFSPSRWSAIRCDCPTWDCNSVFSATRMPIVCICTWKHKSYTVNKQDITQ